jgi:hypothetical protein
MELSFGNRHGLIDNSKSQTHEVVVTNYEIMHRRNMESTGQHEKAGGTHDGAKL